MTTRSARSAAPPATARLKAGLASLEHDPSPAADAVRQEFTAHLEHDHEGDAGHGGDGPGAEHTRLHREALAAARQAVLAMRESDEIGDDAFHEVEEELDWLEMADGNQGK